VLRDGKPAGMSTLALFWPHPALAEIGDPLSLLDGDDRLIGADAARERVDERIRVQPEPEDGAWSEPVWEAFFSWPGGWPDGTRGGSDAAACWVAGGGGAVSATGTADSGRGLPGHAKQALEQPPIKRWHDDLALLALPSPGNIAYRALAR